MQDQPLQPLTIGQLLDRAFRLYRNNLVTFLGIVALVQIPSVLLGGVTSLDFLQLSSDPDLLVESMLSGTFFLRTLVYFVGLLVLAFFSYLSLGALARAVGMGYLGERIGIVEAYRQMGRSWTSIIGLFFLAMLLSLLLFFGSLVTIVGICSMVGMLTLFQFATQLAIPIIVLERQGASGALRRAWDLLRRRFWWVLGMILLLLVLENIVVAGPGAVANALITALTGGPLSASSLPLVGQTVVSGLLSIIYLPLQYAIIVLIYIDLRVRTEGLDLNLQTAQLEAEPPSVSALLSSSPEPRQDQLLSLEEYFNFVGVSVLMLVVGVVMATVLGAIGIIGAMGSGLMP